MTQTKKEQIEAFLNNLGIDIDFSNYLNIEEITDYDSISEMLEEKGAFNVEVIYYSRAIEYLSKNDPSLTESLELAHDMGFEANKLNSEILASIHQSDKIRGEWYDLQDEIQEFLDNLEDNNDEL